MIDGRVSPRKRFLQQQLQVQLHYSCLNEQCVRVRVPIGSHLGVLLKLHTKVVYRLALYQVLASLALAMVGALQAIFVNYSKNPYIYDSICTVMGYQFVYRMDEAALHDVGDVASLLFCGTTEEPEET